MTELKKFEAAAADTVLVIIDVQNDFCANGNEFSYFGRRASDVAPMQKVVMNGIIPLLENARNSGMFIIFIKASYKAGQFPEFRQLCIPGTIGWEFYKIWPDMKNPKEMVFEKSGMDCFGSKHDLGKWLLSRGIRNVLIAGFTTDQCVKASALSFAERGFNAIIIEDCVSTAAYKLGVHKKTLGFFRRHPAIRVASSRGLEFTA